MYIYIYIPTWTWSTGYLSHLFIIISTTLQFPSFQITCFQVFIPFFHLNPVWEISAQLSAGTKCRCLSLKMEILSEAQTTLLLVVACLNLFLTLWCQLCSMVVTSIEVMSKCDSKFSFMRKNRSIFALQWICLGRAADLPFECGRIWSSLSGYPIYNYLRQKYLW